MLSERGGLAMVAEADLGFGMEEPTQQTGARWRGRSWLGALSPRPWSRRVPARGVATASSTEITIDATGLSGDHVAGSAAARGVAFRRRLLAAAKGMRSITPYSERGKGKRRGWAGSRP